jgi:hypothetical protein
VPDEDELMAVPPLTVVLVPLLAAVDDGVAEFVARAVADVPSGGSVATADAPALGVEVSVAPALAVLEPVAAGIGVNVGKVVGKAADVGNGLGGGVVLQPASRAGGRRIRASRMRATKGIEEPRIFRDSVPARALRRRRPGSAALPE